MPHFLVELDELRAACARESLAAGFEPSHAAQGAQLDEEPATDTTTEPTAP